MGKKEKRDRISEMIDLTGNRFKDAEYDELFDIVDRPDDYIERSRSFSSKHDGFSSDGKYTREEKSTFRLRNVDGKIFGEEEYEYHDDDGQSGSTTYVFDTARDILNIARIIMGDDHGSVSESRRALSRSLSQRAKKLHEERYANGNQNSFDGTNNESAGIDSEAVVEGAKWLVLGITKYVPKGIAFVAEKGIPAARTLGRLFSRKSRHDD